MSRTPVIDLSKAPGARSAWTKPAWLVYVWSAFELIFVTNPWQISSSLRVGVLRMFGAKIGKGVVFRTRTRVKFPWNLEIGDRSWIGEGVWFHNQDKVTVGNDVAISQESFLTTGSHAMRRDMALITKPIVIHDGVWVTSRCMILGGAILEQSAVVTPGTTVKGVVAENTIVGPMGPIGFRFGSGVED